MPNPIIVRGPTESYLGLHNDWCRIRVQYRPGYVCIAGLQLCCDGVWQDTGPAVEARSAVTAVHALVERCRTYADEIERAWAFDEQVLHGCPRCGYRHPHIGESPDRHYWRCDICHAGGSRPRCGPSDDTPGR